MRRGGAGLVFASLIAFASAPLLPACGDSGGGTPEWPKGNVVLTDANKLKGSPAALTTRDS